jgi:hypothetical protein
MSEGNSGTSGDQGEAGKQDGTEPANRPDDSGSKFDQELQALLTGDALEARFKELSAEERERQAKEASKEAQRRQKTAHKGQRKEQRKARRRRRNRRMLRWSAWSVSVIVLAGACVFAYLRFGHSASATGSPSLLPALSPDFQTGPPADPFQGTPADKWADNAPGITVPAAKAVGPFSAAQVAAAYQTTKKLLIAANLDPKTLAGGKPTAFAALLGTKQQRAQFLGGLNAKGLVKGKVQRANSTRIMVVSFAPGSTQFIGNVIKVHGTMSAHAVTDSGTPELDINVNYIFVYPIEPPGRPTDWMRFFASDYDSYAFAQFDDPGGPLEVWDQSVVGTYGAVCYTTDGYDYPDYPSMRVPNPKQAGKPVDPYNPGKASAAGPNDNPVCGNGSRD